jgi:hypothetical protein
MSGCSRPSSSSGSSSTPCPCPTKVDYKEDPAQTYGFDDKTGGGPWKSVEKGKADTAKADITLGSGTADRAAFASSQTGNVTVAPGNASSANQTLTFTGVAKGESDISASCDGGSLGTMKVKTYEKRTKTVAVRRVNEKTWAKGSTNISDADITAALKKVYMQAVVEFTLTRLPMMSVKFDKNKDGKVDVDSWMSDEMKAIRDACKDDSYDFNVFLVDNPTDGSTGFMDFNQRYAFVHAGNSNNPGQTLAHELGHGQGLQHTNGDSDNLMDPYAEAAKGEFKKYRLRKDQWDSLNP